MTLCNVSTNTLPRASFKHGDIAVVGLIGAIGSGKSEAARILAERGACVIDADAVGHEVLADRAVRARLLERFGSGILAERDARPAAGGAAEPVIDRRRLGKLVFADSEALRDLEAVVHPRMRARFEAAILDYAHAAASGLVVLDAAVLLEAGWDDLCDVIVYLDASPSVRLKRVQTSRGWTAEMLEARERAQLPLESKKGRADLVVRNDGDRHALAQALEELDRLLGRAGVA